MNPTVGFSPRYQGGFECKVSAPPRFFLTLAFIPSLKSLGYSANNIIKLKHLFNRLVTYKNNL